MSSFIQLLHFNNLKFCWFQSRILSRQSIMASSSTSSFGKSPWSTTAWGRYGAQWEKHLACFPWSKSQTGCDTGSGRMKYVRVFKRARARPIRTQVLKIKQTLSGIWTMAVNSFKFRIHFLVCDYYKQTDKCMTKVHCFEFKGKSQWDLRGFSALIQWGVITARASPVNMSFSSYCTDVPARLL